MVSYLPIMSVYSISYFANLKKSEFSAESLTGFPVYFRNCSITYGVCDNVALHETYKKLAV